MTNIIGSHWRVWDLHINTPNTSINNNFLGDSDSDRWDRYLSKIEEHPKVVALGITDYFSINGYHKILNLKAEGRIPNVELRLLPAAGNPNALNYHFLFNPDIVDRLETQFFSELEFQYAGNTYKCNAEDLIRLGREFTGNAHLEKEAAYQTGVEQFKVDFGQVQRLLRKNKLLRENC